MADPARREPEDDLDIDAIEPPPGILCADDPGFAAEIERRIAAVKRGEVETLDADDVLDALDALDP
jgi:hypothetical protein